MATAGRRRRRPTPVRALIIVLAVLWLIVAGLPFAFMVQTALKDQFEFLSSPFWTPPQAFSLKNFETVLGGSFVGSLGNSVIVVGLSLALILLIGSMASYVFARVRFRSSGAIFALVLAGLVIPVHVTLLPVYLLTTSLGTYDSIWALIGPYVAFNLPLAIFVLTEFMRHIPRELEEAARMDGCSTFGVYWRIILPLSRPGLVTVGIFTAVALWNEFVFAYVLTSSPGSRTLPLAIWDYQGQYNANVPLIMAVLTLSALPLIIAYVIGQERVVEGITAGAVKG